MISSDYIDNNTSLANKYISVSNSIIVYDLIKNEKEKENANEKK